MLSVPCAAWHSEGRIFLFCGSDEGGERAAAMYSLIGTAKLDGFGSVAYLRYIIEHIAEHPAMR